MNVLGPDVQQKSSDFNTSYLGSDVYIEKKSISTYVKETIYTGAVQTTSFSKEKFQQTCHKIYQTFLNVKHAIIQKFSEIAHDLSAPLAENGYVESVHNPNDNIRIIFINGILNTRESCERNARKISDIFDGRRVYFTHYPTTSRGWGDILVLIRGIIFGLGTLLATSEKLIENIVERHRELDALNISDTSKKLLIFAHSGGGAILKFSGFLLADELESHKAIMKRSIVYTFGSPAFISNNHWGTVKHIIHRSDPIPLLASYFTASFLRKRIFDCIYVGRMFSNPIRSHEFGNREYQAEVNKLCVAHNGDG